MLQHGMMQWTGWPRKRETEAKGGGVNGKGEAVE